MHYISIAGNIGVGKTTFTEMIGKKLGWETYFEPVIENPYLEDFYGDMKRWSFELQIYFLSKRFISLKEIVDKNQNSVQDRTIYEDSQIFARVLHEQGSMNNRDFENYCSLFDCMLSFLKKPDLIVYLRASTQTLVDRIKMRGRDYEKTIDTDYLNRLNLAYETWISKAQNEFKIITIETDKLNLQELETKIDEIAKLFNV